MAFKPSSFMPVVHHYAPRLLAMEYQPLRGFQPGQARNILLFLGGLSDGIRTVSYPFKIHDHLQNRGYNSWTVCELMIGSSYSGWETGNLDKDCIDVEKAVTYLRSVQQSSKAGGMIVLMGHSTGCQIAAHYCVGPWQAETIPQNTLQRPQLDGVILQACVSDREGLSQHPIVAEPSVQHARQMVADGCGDDHMPAAITKDTFGGALPTARRWLSLASNLREEADDDYFSSDLNDEVVERIWGSGGFGKRGIRVMALQGGKDHSIPPSVDTARMVKNWGNAVGKAGGKWEEDSGVIPGANHSLNEILGEPLEDLCDRVEAFIRSCMEAQCKLES